MNKILASLLFACASLTACAHTTTHYSDPSGVTVDLDPAVDPERYDIQVGAAQFDYYLHLLKGKRVGMLVNQTSIVEHTHLLDTLLSLGVNVTTIYTPEHGFRGEADAGAKVASGKDAKTGLPIVSLYGNNKKPTASQLANIDVMLYDLQDVGVRFYTYISSLEYIMDACGAAGKEVIVLDRPNPLGFWVDGPVLEKSSQSFIGRQAIPVVYGMTAGEYAKMLKGEQWITHHQVALNVVACKFYTHSRKYNLPVSPSPNLKNMAAIYLYPSMCFFEGTNLSLGRGTEHPFLMYGHPSLKGKFDYSFTPKSVVGATNPPLKDQLCYGELVTLDTKEAYALAGTGLNLSYIIKAYQAFPEKSKFFLTNGFFNLLAGNATLRKQIEAGMSEQEIRASWQAGLNQFKKIRKKYLLYPDAKSI